MLAPRTLNLALVALWLGSLLLSSGKCHGKCGLLLPVDVLTERPSGPALYPLHLHQRVHGHEYAHRNFMRGWKPCKLFSISISMFEWWHTKHVAIGLSFPLGHFVVLSFRAALDVTVSKLLQTFGKPNFASMSLAWGDQQSVRYREGRGETTRLDFLRQIRSYW